MTDQQAVQAAGGTQTIQSSGVPGLASYLQFLGMGGGTAAPAAAGTPAVNPAMTAAPATGGLPQGSMNPLLGLGVTGQKAQQNQVPAMPAQQPVTYALPQTQNTRAGASILSLL